MRMHNFFISTSKKSVLFFLFSLIFFVLKYLVCLSILHVHASDILKFFFLASSSSFFSFQSKAFCLKSSKLRQRCWHCCGFPLSFLASTILPLQSFYSSFSFSCSNSRRTLHQINRNRGFGRRLGAEEKTICFYYTYPDCLPEGSYVEEFREEMLKEKLEKDRDKKFYDEILREVEERMSKVDLSKRKSKKFIKKKVKTDDLYSSEHVIRDSEGLPEVRVEANRSFNANVKSKHPFVDPTEFQQKLLNENSFRNNNLEQLLIKKKSYLRISSGERKGKILATPNTSLRPMMNKVKEAIFSILRSMGVLNFGVLCNVLDLYSGSGSVGVEALSNYASFCTFVDSNKICCSCATYNLNICKYSEKGRVLKATAEDVLIKPSRFDLDTKMDLIFACPPYEKVIYKDLMHKIANSSLIKDDCVVIVEYPKELGSLPPVICNGKLVGFRNRKYGRTVIAVYVYNPTEKFNNIQKRFETFVYSK